MATPLLDALKHYAKGRPARFHMPGHKGRHPGGFNVFSLDVTELSGTGDLYAGDDVIARAEALWAETFGFPTCQFLTGGSTQGIHTALLLCARRGRGVLADRCAHRSVHNAMALWGLEPTWLARGQDEPLEPDALREALEGARERGETISTVCITSPTYYGVLSPVTALVQVAHQFGAALVVDGAHGCHLPFLGLKPFAGADLVVCSAHKTLPALGQGALLFASEKFGGAEVKKAAGVTGTSSPSYAIMASMDLARARWSTPGGQRSLAGTAAACKRLGAPFPTLEGVELDPLRLTVLVPGGAGRRWKERLESRGIFAEMADPGHLVFLLAPENTRGELRRLERELKALYQEGDGPLPAAAPPWELPPVRLSPRQAMFASGVRRCLARCEGEICLEQVAPYPPGVPVIAPGEEITKKGLAYLREVGYNVERDVTILDRRKGEEAAP